MRYYSLLQLAALAGLASAQFQPQGIPFKSPVVTASGLSARVIYTNLTALGAITFDEKQNLLAVELGVGVSAFMPITTSTSSGWTRNIVVKNPAASYGIEIDGSKLYVSTGSEVILYAYNASTRSIVPGSTPYPVITGIPADGEFSSHAILLERDARGKAVALLVGTGPLTNIDPTARDPASGRSQIRRFVFPTIVITIFPPPPLPWSTGEVLGYGLRNPAGFAFAPTPIISPLPVEPKHVLYVAENGASIDNVTSMGVTPKFVNDNPADELNVIDYSTDRKKFYGFPDCTTLWNPTADPVGVPQYTGLARGDQISLKLLAERGDKWCREKTNNQAPLLPLQAHSSPTDVKFYEAPASSDNAASLPSEYIGDAFVSFFGSFNRSPPTGYGVVRVFLPVGTSPTTQGYSFVVQAKDLTSCPGSCITPAGLAFSGGKLYFSSVLTGELAVIERNSFTTNP